MIIKINSTKSHFFCVSNFYFLRIILFIKNKYMHIRLGLFNISHTVTWHFSLAWNIVGSILFWCKLNPTGIYYGTVHDYVFADYHLHNCMLFSIL